MPIGAHIVINTKDHGLLSRSLLGQIAEWAYERAQDCRPAWDAVREIIFDWEELIFLHEGEVDGHRRWDDLNKKYAHWKRVYFPGRPILQLTGKLRDHVTGRSNDHYEWRGGRSFRITFNYPTTRGYLGGKTTGALLLDAKGRLRHARYGPDPDLVTSHMIGGPSTWPTLSGLREGYMLMRPPVFTTPLECEMIGKALARYVFGENPQRR